MANNLAPKDEMATKLEDQLRQMRERDSGRLADIQRGDEETGLHFTAMPLASR